MARTGRPAAKATTAEKPAKAARTKTAEAGDKLAYGVPALEKGLDVLELLAAQSKGVTQSEIAQLLGRSLQEVYRVVMALERRGFIQRRPGEDGFFLSNHMHVLANQYPPMRRLLDAALPIMNSASIEAYQALHIAILDRLAIRVVAQVDSPAPLGFRLRVGETGGLQFLDHLVRVDGYDGHRTSNLSKAKNSASNGEDTGMATGGRVGDTQIIRPRNSWTSWPGRKRPMRLISQCSRMPEFSSTRARMSSPRYSRS